MNGPDTSFVIVRKKLSFIGGHVHRNRTLTFASFAGETEIKRFLHRFTLPAIRDHFALQHLPEQPCASSCRMLLFHCHAIARAHRAVASSATFTDTHAAEYGARKTALV